MNDNDFECNDNECGNSKKIIDNHCVQLMEHFDSVLILVTKHNPKENSTIFDWNSRGNMFANSGAAQHFISKEDESSRLCAHFDQDNE